MYYFQNERDFNKDAKVLQLTNIHAAGKNPN
jgi:hypothetical protein